MASNLPPGVRDCDIPGNRPEDAAIEAVEENVLSAFSKEGFTPEEYEMAARVAIMFVRHVRERVREASEE